ncbi:MAG: DNA polymerase III [Candidatus Aminicenantes bacterium RBG_13_64_14]|nr:MAG: DNA polymerase III [Candidatus Aminicenantes bacterium RBG_13_64_14]
MKNREIAGMFDKIADALEIRGETGFKVVAYRKASRILQDMTEDIGEVARQGQLETVPGIGEGLAKKIAEYLGTGKMTKYAEVMKDVPESLLGLLEIQGLGGKTVHFMHKELGVKDLAGLKRAIADGSLAGLPGMGEKKVENIRKGIEARERGAERISICEAARVADEVIAYLEKAPGISRVSAAGSLRRMKETVGDIDILACGKNGAEIVRYFARHPDTVRVLAAGETKGSIVVRAGETERQVDLRVVDGAAYGAALLYFTGSKAHNIKLRGLAKDRGLKISEYGVFRGAKRLAAREEEDCYRVLKMPWVPPEMREDRGEVELAREGRLPRLVETGDIKGDLHVHTRASDGDLTLAEVVGLARKMGYSYVAICDHSQAANYAHGLAADRLAAEIEEIEAFNRTLKGFRILKGSEVDIRTDGSLDFPDELLGRLDFVVAAVHSGFRKNVTERMLKALENPYVRTIAHPTGRLISGREGYDVDIERVIDGAARLGKALELNSYCDRLDLDELRLKKAKEKGVKITMGTDTHFADGLAMMRFGLGIARRAWLGPGDILNCLSAESLLGKTAAKTGRGRRSSSDPGKSPVKV